MGGLEGVGWTLGVGGKPKAGNAIHNETDSSNVALVGHRNRHSQPGRPIKTIICNNLIHHVASLVPVSGPIDPVIGCHGFTGSAITACKSRPGHP